MAGKEPGKETVTALNPYSEGEKTPQVEAMFNNIASTYDRLNALMTMGMHTVWRRKALRGLQQAVGADTSAPLLDVATGTGDVAADLRRLFPNAPITGIDISDGMMSVARRKMERRGLKGITFRQADCQALPFEDNTFGAVTVAYGVRNFADLQRGYSEMLRVLKPGGRLCVIELCVPRNPLLRFGYRLYTRSLLPLIGRIISRDSRAYSYLPQSVEACPQRGAMTQLMTNAGFQKAACKVLPPNVIAIYTASKPGSKPQA